MSVWDGSGEGDTSWLIRWVAPGKQNIVFFFFNGVGLRKRTYPSTRGHPSSNVRRSRSRTLPGGTTWRKKGHEIFFFCILPLSFGKARHGKVAMASQLCPSRRFHGLELQRCSSPPCRISPCPLQPLAGHCVGGGVVTWVAFV